MYAFNIKIGNRLDRTGGFGALEAGRLDVERGVSGPAGKCQAHSRKIFCLNVLFAPSVDGPSSRTPHAPSHESPTQSLGRSAPRSGDAKVYIRRALPQLKDPD